MEDRVRIYELARKMGLPNQVLINKLRELGYDIKSHSSTVDSTAVGRLIAALGNSKQQDASKGNKAGVKAAVVAPPPAPVVKPRVLNRYRKPSAEPAADAASPVIAEGGSAVNALSNEAKAIEQEVSATPVVEVELPESVVPEVESPLSAPDHEAVTEPEAEENALSGAIHAAVSLPEEEAEVPEAELESKNLVPEKAEEELPPVPETEDDSNRVQSLRPMQPSVPTRVAAPSFRPTPSRPQKPHRQSPSERHGQKRDEKKQSAATIEVPKVIALSNPLSVKELSEVMSVSETEIIKRLFIKGFMRTVNQMVELELARDLAVEMGYELTSLEDMQIQEALEKEERDQEHKDKLTDDEEASLVARPPVVTIMGHVDHGKTSLLDAIRQTKFLLTDSEAGGITQHIGAYHVEVPAEDGQMRQIVFLDTPGHEAFTAMRARGARVTDIAILVVAADDGVMPQTIEAIDHAKAAGVPIIVAVNKVDKAEAEPDRVLTQLMEHGLVPDRFGGDTVTVNVSAKKRTGLDELLEMILLVADMQDLKANPERNAVGTIIEAKLHRGKGAVVTALVQNGTLRLGDFIVAGSMHGRVRALHDDRAQQVRAAGPSMPVEVLGLPEVPDAGDRFEVVSDLSAAKTITDERKRQEADRKIHRVTLESLHDLVEQGEVRELNVIVKADVQGTAEAIADQIRKLSTKEVQVRVLRIAAGDISENDVNLAASSNAIIIGFGVQPDSNASRAAESAGVDVRTYNIIYEIIDNIELAMQGMLQPIKQEVQLGTAEVRQIFKVGKNSVIAGCMITNGKIQRNAMVRVERGGKIIHEGKIDNLKRFKDDVREVAQGFECGMSIDKFNDLIEGDLIHGYIIQEVKRVLIR